MWLPFNLIAKNEDVDVEERGIEVQGLRESGHGDDDDDDEEEEHKRATRRALVCLTMLAAVWLTSLQVSITLVHYAIPTPLAVDVHATCSYALDQSRDQADEFKLCADYQIAACDRQYVEATAEEALRVAKVAANNSVSVAAFQARQTNCSSALSLARAAIQRWGMYSGNVPLQYRTTSCSSEDISQLQAFLGVTDAATTQQQSAVYAAQIQTSAAGISDYSVALSNYNAQYVQNKSRAVLNASAVIDGLSNNFLVALSSSGAQLNQTLMQVQACFVANSTGSSLCSKDGSLSSQYSLLRDTNLAQLHYLNASFFVLDEMYNNYVSRVLAARAEADKFYSVVASSSGIITWIMNNVKGVPGLTSLCSKTTPSWCSFSPDDWFAAYNLPNLPHPFQNLPSVSDFLIDSGPIFGSAEKAMAASLSRMQTQFATFQKSVQLHLHSLHNSILTDYNPPKYSSSVSSSSSAGTQSEFNASMALAEIATLSQKLLHSASSVSSNISISSSANISASNMLRDSFGEFQSRVKNVPLSQFQLSWTDFDFSGVKVEIISASFGNMLVVLNMFDVIYRTLYSLVIVSKYWTKSIVEFPELDLRRKRKLPDKSFFLGLRLFLRISPVIWLQILALVALAGIVLWFSSEVFMLELRSYSAGCVTHTANSTIISRNLYSAAFNMASYNGNDIVNKGIERYNFQMSKDCSTNYASTSTSLQSNLASFISTNSSLSTDIHYIDLMWRCSDIPTLDAHFATTCAGASASYKNCPKLDTDPTLPFSSPGTYLNSSYCAQASINSTLQDSLYDCSRLPKCRITCRGPNTKLLQTFTKECSCMAEWYGISSLLSVLFGALFYLGLNVARVLVTNGILRLMWDRLFSPTFEIRANCDAEGRIVLAPAPATASASASGSLTAPSTPQSIRVRRTSFERNDSGLKSLQDAICLEHVQAMVTTYKRKGAIKIALGLAIIVVMFTLLLVLSQDIAYRRV